MTTYLYFQHLLYQSEVMAACHWHARDYDGQHIETDRHKVITTLRPRCKLK